MNFNRIPPSKTGDDPPLTGWTYKFQAYISTQFSLPREDKVVDFLIPSLRIPIEVDGEIGHGTTTQQANDARRDAILNPSLQKLGYSPIKHILWHDLEDQDLADLAARDLI
jgi:very-short-patch-repair endonuclease